MAPPSRRTRCAVVRLVAVGACGWQLASCGAPTRAPAGLAASDGRQARQPIIYDSDDRRDVYDHLELSLRALVKSSVVALVPHSTLVVADDGSIEFRAQSLEAAYQLCPGARFADQPTAAACSGVLIGPDLVLTAGHCLRQGLGQELLCEQHAYVFDYFYRGPDRLESMTRDDVFDCTEIVTVTHPAGLEHELAVVRLDREVDSTRMPVSFGRERPSVGERVTVLGFPSGLPAKIDTGASVVDTASEEPSSIALDSDTFACSSGSGVFDEHRQLIGLVLSGGRDYEVTDAGCLQIREVDAAKTDTFERASTTDWIPDALTAGAAEAAETALVERAGARGAADRGAVTCAVSFPYSGSSCCLFGYALVVSAVRRARVHRRARPGRG